MAKKINLNGAKEFLFQHGEKVALGTCGFLALLFGVMGLMDALSAGRSPDSGKAWADELKSQHDRIQMSMTSAEIPKLSADAREALKPEGYAWNNVPSGYVPQPYINIPDVANDKRQNPRALAIKKNSDKGPRYQQLDYVPALVFAYEKLPTKQELRILELGGGGGPAFPAPGLAKKGMAGGGGAGGNNHFLKKGDPRRMVVGHLVVPLKEQVQEFQRALKYLSQKEMFDAPREDLPSYIGFDLWKIELLPNGEPAKKDPDVLVWCNGLPPKAPTISDKLKNFLKAAVFDERSAAALEPFVHTGLTMPLPELAFGSYPPVSLSNGKIQSAADMDGMDDMTPKGPKKGPGIGKPPLPGTQKPPPMAKQPMAKDNEPGYTPGSISRKKLQADGPFELALDGRFFDNDFNVYHALGVKFLLPGAEAPVAQAPGLRGPGGAQNERFVDAWDVKADPADPDKQPGLKPPGKGAVGAAEPAAFPNWPRDAVVRFIDLDVEPGKTYRYRIRLHLKNPNFGKTTKDVAYDALTKVEELISEWEYTDSITIPGDYFLYAFDQKLHDDGKAPADKLKDTTMFQIHQWTGTPGVTNDQRDVYPIGDWVVAERVPVHKGSPIGPLASAKVPWWVSIKDAFEVKKPHLTIDMMPPFVNNTGNGIVGDYGYPILVDFTGGKRKVAPNSNVDEEVAVNALIVGADGKLRVLNSRDAAENTPFGQDRQARGRPGARQARWMKLQRGRSLRPIRIRECRKRAYRAAAATNCPCDPP